MNLLLNEIVFNTKSKFFQYVKYLKNHIFPLDIEL